MTRNRLRNTRSSVTHHSEDPEFYVTVGFYEHSAKPGELFVQIAKHGSDVAGFVDGFAIMISLALQHGVPWEDISKKFEHRGCVLEAICDAVNTCIQEERGKYE